MKLLETPKGNFYLAAPIEILHRESAEWLKEIEFWKDEAAFFYTLLLKKGDKKPKTKAILNIENHLIYISSEKLDDLKLEIQTHERFLAGILESVRPDNEKYRTKHLSLSKKMYDFENEFKALKRQIFSFVKGKNKVVLTLAK